MGKSGPIWLVIRFTVIATSLTPKVGSSVFKVQTALSLVAG